MKVKTPKTKTGTPDKNLSKVMKVDTPKSKTPKQDKIKTPKSVLNFNTPKGRTPKSEKVNTPVMKTPKQEKLKTPKQEKSKTTNQKKLKTPKVNGNSPKENSPKKLKTESPIAKSPKKEKKIKPKPVDLEPKSYNVYLKLDSRLHSKDCLKNTLSEVLDVMNKGRLTATRSLCFQFQEEAAALKSLKTIENLKFKETDFKADMSINTYEPLRRCLYVGKDANLDIVMANVKKAFKAELIEPIKYFRKFTGLLMLTFNSVQLAAASDKIKFNYGGEVRQCRPYLAKPEKTKELLEKKSETVAKKQKLSNGDVADAKKKNDNKTKKRKVEVQEESEEEEEDDDEEEEEEETNGMDDEESDDDGEDEEEDDDDDEEEEDDDDEEE